MRFHFKRGYAYYEMQVGRIYFNFCHLLGGGWHWYNLWDRIRVGIDRT